MTDAEIKECQNLIFQWSEQNSHKEKDEIRNRIFHIMQTQLEMWIKSICRAKGSFLLPDDIKSKSWECFHYALKHYKPNGRIPLCNHFYSYSRFKLITIETEKEIQNEDIIAKETGADGLDSIYGHIEELKSFREFLMKEEDDKHNKYAAGYAGVFDDAILSLVPNRPDRTSHFDKKIMPYTKYLEAKKVLKLIVKFLLVR